PHRPALRSLRPGRPRLFVPAEDRAARGVVVGGRGKRRGRGGAEEKAGGMRSCAFPIFGKAWVKWRPRRSVSLRLRLCVFPSFAPSVTANRIAKSARFRQRK